MEATSFHADGEVIRMYKRTQQQQQQQPQDVACVAPLFTIANVDSCKACRNHKRMDDAFQALFGQVHVLDLTVSLSNSAPAAASLHDQRQQQPTHKTTTTTTTSHLGFLQHFVTSKLSKAFSLTSADHFQGFLSCSSVTIGGFGGTWHHDATSQLTSDDGTAFEYLALYYLNDDDCDCDCNMTLTTGSSYNWLECALQTQEDEPTNLIHTFCPVSTIRGHLLVLRNDIMMHRTPVLCSLVPGSVVRRFFYMPFRALDHEDHPVILVPPRDAVWAPYRTEPWIEQQIDSELKEHHVQMDMKEYILYGRAFLSLPWSEDLLSERPNWLFDDPDDY